MHKLVLLLLPFLASGVAAQDALDDQQIDIRRYTVEVIIFSYAQSVSAGTEIFIPDAPPIEELLGEDAFDVETPQLILESKPTVEAIELVEEDEDQYELEMLDKDDFGLVEIYGHLKRLDAYKPLVHFGWTQPTYPDQENEARPLSSFVTPPEGLEGELNLYLSRYLHLDVKLQLDAPLENASVRQPPGEFEPFGMIEETYPVRYRIDEDRIFRNGELRYYDHPKFGVIAKITRVEEVDPDEEEFLGETELLGFGSE
jgi:hypothetical protein